MYEDHWPRLTWNWTENLGCRAKRRKQTSGRRSESRTSRERVVRGLNVLAANYCGLFAILPHEQLLVNFPDPFPDHDLEKSVARVRIWEPDEGDDENASKSEDLLASHAPEYSVPRRNNSHNIQAKIDREQICIAQAVKYKGGYLIFHNKKNNYPFTLFCHLFNY